MKRLREMLRWLIDIYRNKSIKEDLFKGDRCKFLARDIVLNQIKPLDGNGISYTSSNKVRVVVIGSDKLSLYIARQAALVCHYPNFNELTGDNRTVITIVHPSAVSIEDVKALKREFESITGNLLKEAIWCCKYYNGATLKEWVDGSEKTSFIDVQFEFIGVQSEQLDRFVVEQAPKPNDGNATVSVIDNSKSLSGDAKTQLEEKVYQCYTVPENVRKGEVTNFGIDIRRAQMVKMVYDMGTCLNSICVADMFEVEEYRSAVSILCKQTTRIAIWRGWSKIEGDVDQKLSNLFSADCIASKLRSVDGHNWGSYGMLESLAKSEHARWNVEKLILGFRVYTAEESYRCERLFADADALRRERTRLKTDPKEKAHINLCSCDDLMRIEPSSFKYDCFLVMAAECIAERIKDDK